MEGLMGPASGRNRVSEAGSAGVGSLVAVLWVWLLSLILLPLALYWLGMVLRG
jgi:hypothetical protein